MTSAPWVLIAAIIAAAASIINVIISTKANSRNALMNAKSKLADLELEWGDTFAERVATLEMYIDKHKLLSAADIPEDEKLETHKVFLQIEFMLDDSVHEHLLLKKALNELRVEAFFFNPAKSSQEYLKQSLDYGDVKQEFIKQAKALILQSRRTAKNLVLSETS